MQKKLILIILLISVFIFSQVSFANTITIEDNLVAGVDTNAGEVWSDLLTKYKNFVPILAAIGACSMVLFFIICFIKLGATSTNSKARQNIIIALWVTGISAAGLGSVALITGVFYSLLN